MNQQVIFLATVDGDLRLGDLEQQKAAVRRLFALFDELGLRGCVTCFVNENDSCWTTAHGDLLLEIVQRGDAVGVHDHFDTHLALAYEPALALARRSLERVRGFYRRSGLDVPLIAHRNGCFFQSEAIYRALRALGYRVVSDVWPGVRASRRMVKAQDTPQQWLGLDGDPAFLVDNTMVPLAGNLWWHDEDDWLRYTGRQGAFLQVPVISAPYIEIDRMAQAAAAARGPVAYLTWDTHPYNIQDEATAGVDERMVADFRARLLEIRTRFHPEWLHINGLWQRIQEAD